MNGERRTAAPPLAPHSRNCATAIKHVSDHEHFCRVTVLPAISKPIGDREEAGAIYQRDRKECASESRYFGLGQSRQGQGLIPREEGMQTTLILFLKPI